MQGGCISDRSRIGKKQKYFNGTTHLPPIILNFVKLIDSVSFISIKRDQMNFKYDRMCIVLKIYIFTFVMYVVNYVILKMFTCFNNLQYCS